MSDHNLSARLWATAAVLAVPLATRTGLGWWLPLHLALLGAATQAVVGGQLMFTATLGLARGPSRTSAVSQLALLNAGAVLVVAGRWAGHRMAFVAGATLVVLTVIWVAWQVDGMSRRSVNKRFVITGTFYRLAALSVVTGATIGAALGAGAFDDPTSYLGHRTLHFAFNVLGWTGLTIVGTAITLLPTILHVRAPDLERVRNTPWLMFGGLVVMSTGISFELPWLAATGMLGYTSGLVFFGAYARRILATPRRRKVPTAALHLIAALAWAFATAVALILTSATGEHQASRDFIVAGGAVGFVFQALLGAWSFLLPSTRAPIPDRRRRELVAMELGGRAQVVAYNLGALLALVALRTGVETGMLGTALAWTAAAWALTKSWTFPLLARLAVIRRWSERWWEPPPEKPS